MRAPRCGDGLLRVDRAVGERGYEACDDGNEDNTDECLDDCSVARCGDGHVREGLNPEDTGFEACDDGNNDNLDACIEGCRVARCGDGFLRGDVAEGDEGYEACDDGNTDDDDGCAGDCSELPATVATASWKCRRRLAMITTVSMVMIAVPIVARI